MSTNPLTDAVLTLGGFLRDRRGRLSPAPGAHGRRRTPGLRREEVATRANVSVTWYTWLEQGRGGPPSEEVLERLARALELDAADREFMFLLAQQRPPPLKTLPSYAATASLQQVLDGFTASPAIIKTPAWDIVAWNAAATAILTDYTSKTPTERNLLRRLFSQPRMRASLPDWEPDARFALATFRIDAARAGNCPEAAALAAELQASSPEFRRMWADNETSSHYVGRKRIRRPGVGTLMLEYQSLSIDSVAGLSMVVFTPVTAADAAGIALLLSGKTGTNPSAATGTRLTAAARDDPGPTASP
ncbi:MAG: transcriptional regulator, family-like protein [Polaromonas sp.]|nr:transcriptional regulator, family-like protein [Polaromonas sp.]